MPNMSILDFNTTNVNTSSEYLKSDKAQEHLDTFIAVAEEILEQDIPDVEIGSDGDLSKGEEGTLKSVISGLINRHSELMEAEKFEEADRLTTVSMGLGEILEIDRNPNYLDPDSEFNDLPKSVARIEDYSSTLAPSGHSTTLALDLNQSILPE